MSVADVCRSIANTVRLTTGLTYTPDLAPEAIHGWPAMVIYPDAGTMRPFAHSDEAGNPKSLHTLTINVQIHIPREDLSRDYATLLPFASDVPRALMSKFWRDDFDGMTISLGDPRGASSSAAIRWEIAPDSWGDNATNTLALKVAIDVSIEEEVL